MIKIKLNQKNIPLIATFAVFFIIYLAGSILYKNFFSLRVFVNLFISNAAIGIVAIGMTFVIISGGIDLSVGSVIAFTTMLIARLIEEGNVHPIIAIIIAMLCGAVLGICMGSLIHFFELPPFLVTLVGMFFMRGLTYMVSTNPIEITHPFHHNIAMFKIPLISGVKIPVTVIIFLLVFVFGVILSRRTKFGRNIYAIGGNEQSSILMGLPVGRTKIFIYVLNSVLCALAGVVWSFETKAGYALTGVLFELDVIASVVIGGTLLSGGIGFVEGTLVGVLIFGLIKTIIDFQGNLSSWWIKIVIGILLLGFILLHRYLSLRTAKPEKLDVSL
jgi:simple sugar transport system permease protein